MQRAYSTLEIKAVGDTSGTRRFTGVASTIAVDRMSDVVEPRGMRATLPVALLWQHNAAEPIGWVKSTRTSDTTIEVDCEVATIAEAGSLQERLDTAWQSITSGLVRGLSVGFRALESERIAGGGTRWTSWEMLELSCVSIPANSQCGISQIKAADQALRRTASGSHGIVADTSEGEAAMDRAQADFDRAFSRGDPDGMKSIAGSDAFKRAMVRAARLRAGEMTRADGDQTHVARVVMRLLVESEMRSAIVKIQRAYRKSLEARVDKLAQQVSAATKAIAALERKAAGQ